MESYYELDSKITFEKIALYQKSVLKSNFPNAYLKESSFLSKPNNSISTQFNGVISTNNLFKNTKYEITSNPYLIHFTSLNSLSLIFNSGYLRMSDFNCLSDKTELIYASKIFSDLDENQIKKLSKSRENLFCLSACVSSEENLKNDFMWQNYAQKHSGCIIEFNFEELNISNMIFGKVHYGRRTLDLIEKCYKSAHKFNLDHNFKVDDLTTFLTKILVFHKHIKYKNEQECRLFFQREGGFLNNSKHFYEYRDFYTDNQVRNFIKIPIKKTELESSIELSLEKRPDLFPLINVSRVIIGPENKEIDQTIIQLIELRKTTKINFEIWRMNERYLLNKII